MEGFETDPSLANITSQKQHHIPGKRMTEISVTFKEIKDACRSPLCLRLVHQSGLSRNVKGPGG